MNSIIKDIFPSLLKLETARAINVWPVLGPLAQCLDMVEVNLEDFIVPSFAVTRIYSEIIGIICMELYVWYE